MILIMQYLLYVFELDDELREEKNTEVCTIVTEINKLKQSRSL